MQREKFFNKFFLIILQFASLATTTEYWISSIFFFVCVPVLQTEENDRKSVCIQNTTVATKRTGYYTIKNKIQYNGNNFVTEEHLLSHKFSFLKDKRDYHNHCLNPYITETM